MKRHWLIAGALMIAAAVAWADMPSSRNRWGLVVQSPSLSSSGGTLTGGILVSGACATMASGDVCCYDNNGVQCGFPVTDVAPDGFRLYGHSSSPLTTSGAGGNLRIAGGEGATYGLVANATCGAGDTITLTVSGDATPNVCTRDATTTAAVSAHAGTFVCNATPQTLATNIATCLNGVSGIHACAGSSCASTAGFTGTDGVLYVMRDSTDPSVAAFTLTSSDTAVINPVNGTGGTVSIHNGVGANTSGEFLFGVGSVNTLSGSQYTWSSSATNASTAADTGIKRIGAAHMGISDGSTGNGRLQTADGAAATPAIHGSTDATDGAYFDGSQFYITLNSTRVFSKDTTAISWGSGSADNCINRVAGARSYVDNCGGGVGTLGNNRRANPQTSNFSVSGITDAADVYTNTGASGKITGTLPAAAAGMFMTFYCQNTNDLQITAVGDDTITVAGTVTGAAGSFCLDDAGDSITLEAISTTQWVAIASVGTPTSGTCP